MLSRLGAAWRRLRELLDPHRWAVKCLGLEVESDRRPGLLMIQIDGLSRAQLEAALAAGRMPFLARLLAAEGYRLHTLYSGLPSSTPSFQGELFYGEAGAVPAFGFRDPETGALVTMLEPEATARVEARLAREGEPLLAGGSAYCDIYSGGAAETHFCPSTLELSTLVPASGQLALSRFLLMHARNAVQAGFLAVRELALSILDCVRGIRAGETLRQELLFVPTRVAVSVLLRELSAAGVLMDLIRGLPVIHVNLPGYDELAHRRGPSSAFAHGTLGAIDRTIARLWRAAHRATGRDYDVWIYSDHGQETTIPFERATGASLGAVLEDALGSTPFRWIAKGPIGHVYADGSSSGDRARFAARLVERGVPLVLARNPDGNVGAWTARGAFALPRDAAAVLGSAHPFLSETAVDLTALCRHAAAGDLVLSGFRPEGPQLSFPDENGSHAGPGPEETSAFALLPAGAPIATHASGHLRPLDLRRAALVRLGRAPRAPRPFRAPARSLRVVTWNVHRCCGIDGVLSPDRIARVLASLDADVIALQELDVGRPRTGALDQAFEIAYRLDMRHHFHPALEIEEERYGDAILSRLPMRLKRTGALPWMPGALVAEPRGALWVAIAAAGTEVELFNTHFGLMPGERLRQAEALVGPDWLAHPDCTGPVALVGDFNSVPGSPPYRRLASTLTDAQIALDGHRPRPTWCSTFPVGRIDHVFVGPRLTVRSVMVPRSALVVAASDHLPVVVDVDVAA